MTNRLKQKIVIIGALTIGSFSVVYFGAPFFTSVEYSNASNNKKETIVAQKAKVVKPVGFVATHINTPKEVRGIYMTACVAATPSFRRKLVKLIGETELNSVVIDIKDYSGTISFKTDNPNLKDLKGKGCRSLDMRKFIQSLHDKNIYVIGRITVFQDPYYSKKYPELAVKRKSDKNKIWKDHKGISYIDPGAKKFWKYIVDLSKESYKTGFDEINYDYIRFPSDGNLEDVYYPFSEKQITSDPKFGRAKIMQSFAKYVNKNMSGTGAVLSADLFGYTTTNFDDLGIGQVLERTLPYFNYVMPMVYPSHYNRGFIGIKYPAKSPYKVVGYSLRHAVKRIKDLKDAGNSTSTTTKAIYLRDLAKSGNDDLDKNQIRPWLQDFNLGAFYTPKMVRTEIQAVYDSGLNSWVLWDAANRYTKEALLK